MELGQRIRAAIEVTRPSNSIAAGVLTFVGTFVAGDPISVTSAVAVVATILATGAGMAINDYVDRDIDRINRPGRPIPRGAISAQWVLFEAIVLFTIAVALALTLPPLAIAIAGINLGALVTYTSLFKGTPGVGNVVVAALSGSTFLFGGAAVGAPGPTAVLFVLAAFATLGREVIKDIEDIDGDRAAGLDTLPIRFGPRRARWVASAALLVATAASPLPVVLDLFGLAYVAVVVPAIAIMLYGLWVSETTPGQGQRLIKIGMYVAILAFVVGRLTV